MNLDIPSMHGYGTDYEKTAFLYLNGQSRTADERLYSNFRIGRVTENIALLKKNYFHESCRVRRVGTDALLEYQLRTLSRITKPQAP